MGIKLCLRDLWKEDVYPSVEAKEASYFTERPGRPHLAAAGKSRTAAIVGPRREGPGKVPFRHRPLMQDGSMSGVVA